MFKLAFAHTLFVLRECAQTTACHKSVSRASRQLEKYSCTCTAGGGLTQKNTQMVARKTGWEFALCRFQCTEISARKTAEGSTCYVRKRHNNQQCCLNRGEIKQRTMVFRVRDCCWVYFLHLCAASYWFLWLVNRAIVWLLKQCLKRANIVCDS